MYATDHPFGNTNSLASVKKNFPLPETGRTVNGFASEVSQLERKFKNEKAQPNKGKAADGLERTSAKEGKLDSSEVLTSVASKSITDNSHEKEAVPFVPLSSQTIDTEEKSILDEGMEVVLKANDMSSAQTQPKDLVSTSDEQYSQSGWGPEPIAESEAKIGQGQNPTKNIADEGPKDLSHGHASSAKSALSSRSIETETVADKSKPKAIGADLPDVVRSGQTKVAASDAPLPAGTSAKLSQADDVGALKSSSTNAEAVPNNGKAPQRVLFDFTKGTETVQLAQSQKVSQLRSTRFDAEATVQPGNRKPELADTMQDALQPNSVKQQTKVSNLLALSVEGSIPVGSSSTEDPFIFNAASERQISLTGPKSGHIGPPSQAFNVQPINQAVSVAIDAKVKGTGSDTIDLMLEPQELGRLRITLITRETGLFVMLTAERNETLDLLRRNAEELRSNLESLDLGGAQLDFEHQPNDPHWSDNKDDTELETVVSLIPKPDTALIYALSSNDRMDLRL